MASHALATRFRKSIEYGAIAPPARVPRRRPSSLYKSKTLEVLTGLLTFWNGLFGPLIFDDYFSITSNRTISSLATSLAPPAGSAVAGRPIVNLSYALNDALAGLDLRVFHATNLAIHIACALLLFAVLRRSFERAAVAGDGVALACALVWMVHPLESEAVDYVSARTESLMACFYLLTIYTGIRALERTHRTQWSILCIVCCALGMGCKESMVTAPVLLALYDRVFVYDSWKDAWRDRWPLYAGLAITWIELAVLVAGGPRAASAGLSADPGLVTPVSPWTYLLNQAEMIPRYLRLAVWPRGLVLDYGLPRPLTIGAVAPGAALVLALLFATSIALGRWPRAGFLGAWFFVTLAPASSIVPIHTEAGAERRMYLPMMALAVLAVFAASAVLRRFGVSRVGRTCVAAACVVVLAGATVQRNAEYQTGISIWQTVVDRRPHGRARYNLAMLLKADGRREDMLAELREAVRDYPDARYGLGQELFDERSYAESIAELRAFIRDRPSHEAVVPARLIVGRALAAQGRYGDALPEYRFYLSIHAENAGAWTDYGIALAAGGQTGEAVKAFARAVSLQPSSGAAHRNLANARLGSGDYAGAETEAREALRLDPADAVAREILALAQARQQNKTRRSFLRRVL